jgi:hypothetical protein
MRLCGHLLSLNFYYAFIRILFLFFPSDLSLQSLLYVSLLGCLVVATWDESHDSDYYGDCIYRSSELTQDEALRVSSSLPANEPLPSLLHVSSLGFLVVATWDEAQDSDYYGDSTY